MFFFLNYGDILSSLNFHYIYELFYWVGCRSAMQSKSIAIVIFDFVLSLEIFELLVVWWFGATVLIGRGLTTADVRKNNTYLIASHCFVIVAKWNSSWVNWTKCRHTVISPWCTYSMLHSTHTHNIVLHIKICVNMFHLSVKMDRKLVRMIDLSDMSRSVFSFQVIAFTFYALIQWYT